MNKKWPIAGIIWCEAEQVACAYCNKKDGSCKAARCNIHDDDYIRRQAEIEKTRKENDEKQKMQKSKKERPAPIRNDSNKAAYQIENLEKKARYYHSRGWTKIAFEMEDKAAELKRKL